MIEYSQTQKMETLYSMYRNVRMVCEYRNVDKSAVRTEPSTEASVMLEKNEPSDKTVEDCCSNT